MVVSNFTGETQASSMVRSPQVQTHHEPLNCQSPQVQSRNSSSGQLEKHEPPQVQRRNTSLPKWSSEETQAVQEQMINTSLLVGLRVSTQKHEHLNCRSPQLLIWSEWEIRGKRVTVSASRRQTRASKSGQSEKHGPPHKKNPRLLN